MVVDASTLVVYPNRRQTSWVVAPAPSSVVVGDVSTSCIVERRSPHRVVVAYASTFTGCIPPPIASTIVLPLASTIVAVEVTAVLIFAGRTSLLACHTPPPSHGQ